MVDAIIVPVAVLPPATPFTSQVTTVLVLVEVEELVRLTVATNCVVPLIGTLAVVGVIETEETVLEPEPPPHAARVSAHAMANASKDGTVALFCMGKLFLDFGRLGQLPPRRRMATPHPALPWKTFVRLGLPETDLLHPVLAAGNCSIPASDYKVPEYSCRLSSAARPPEGG